MPQHFASQRIRKLVHKYQFQLALLGRTNMQEYRKFESLFGLIVPSSGCLSEKMRLGTVHWKRLKIFWVIYYAHGWTILNLLLPPVFQHTYLGCKVIVKHADSNGSNKVNDLYLTFFKKKPKSKIFVRSSTKPAMGVIMLSTKR